MAEVQENNKATELFPAVRNDCEEINGKDGKKVDSKYDNESLVLQNNNISVEIKRERNVRRSILVSFVILLLLVLCVVIIVLLVRLSHEKAKENEACLTKDCVTVAARLIAGSNFSVNPCTNFYEYACGGWKASSFIPASKSEWNGFTSLREKTAHIVKRALDSKTHSYKKGSAVGKLFDFYDSCTDEKKLDSLAAAPLQTLLKDLGSWPVLNDSWNGAQWKVEDAIFLYHGIFFSYYHHGRPAPIFNSYVKVDDRNSTSNIISIDQPEFTLIPRHYQTNQKRWKEIFGSYERMVREYVGILGGNKTTTDVLELLDFEMKIANASATPSVFRDVMKSYTTMTIKEFTTLVGNGFDWKFYLSKTFAPVKVAIEDTTMIGTRSLQYLKEISKLLAATPKRVIANYLGWVVVHKFGTHLSSSLRKVDFKFRRVALGVNKDTDHWFKCFEVVEDNMDMAVARIFSRASMLQKATTVIKTGEKDEDLLPICEDFSVYHLRPPFWGRKVIEGVKKTFIKRLSSLEWMDDATKIKAKAKVHAIICALIGPRCNDQCGVYCLGKFSSKANRMIQDIGYPKFIDDLKKLDQIYGKLQISKDSYLKNLVNSYRLRRLKNLELINNPVDKRIWDLAPTLVNAYYDVSNNKMVFLAGILDNPFFDVRGDMSLRYGSFGFVVGHEITHGFDDQGRLYDSTGRLYDSRGNVKDWWSKSSAKAFKEKASCIEKQYSSYKYLDLNVNGNMTLGENIADIGGLKIAFKAYKQWEEENGKEPKLPGLDLNHDQLFFLSFGQLWCGIYNEKKGREVVQRDVHSLPNLRVTGPLSNMEEFSDAFNCPADSPMIKKDKCKMW